VGSGGPEGRLACAVHPVTGESRLAAQARTALRGSSHGRQGHKQQHTAAAGRSLASRDQPRRRQRRKSDRRRGVVYPPGVVRGAYDDIASGSSWDRRRGPRRPSSRTRSTGGGWSASAGRMVPSPPPLPNLHQHRLLHLRDRLRDLGVPTAKPSPTPLRRCCMGAEAASSAYMVWSHCRSTNRGTKYVIESGITWMRGITA
jgi:hypothetical protein